MGLNGLSHNLIFAVFFLLFIFTETSLATNPSHPQTTQSWIDNLFGGAIFEQGFRGPLEHNLSSAILLQLRHDNGKFFIPVNIGPTFHYLSDKGLQERGLSKSQKYLGKSLQLETGFSLYLFGTNISPYAGIGTLVSIGGAIDPGDIADFKTRMDGGILNDNIANSTEVTNARRLTTFAVYPVFGIEFLRKRAFCRLYLEFRYGYCLTNRGNGHGPQIAIGFVFKNGF